MASNLNQKLSHLRVLRADIQRQEALLSGLKAARDNLSDDIMAIMRKDGMLSLRQDWGSVSMVERPSLKIVDPIKVQWWLKMESGHEPEDYLKLDTMRAKAILENAILGDGELIEGTSIEKSTYLTLREKKSDDSPDNHA